MEYDELKKKVDKIKNRVLIKKKKPMTSDVYDLLLFVEQQAKQIEDLVSGADNLTNQANKLIDFFQPQDNPKIDIKIVDLKSQNPLRQALSINNGDMDLSIKQFIKENKDIILDEAEEARNKFINEWGEDCLEVTILDVLIKKIEDM